MQDVLGRHLGLAKQSNVLSSDDVGILILGDSADRNLIFDLCIEAGQQVRSQVAWPHDHGKPVRST